MISKHANPNHSRASLNFVEPGLYMLLRFQKAAVQGNYETGNQAFSMHLRFLTIRHLPRVRRARNSYAHTNMLTSHRVSSKNRRARSTHARTSLQAQAIDKSRESQQNGTLRRECLDHLLFWTTSDLEKKLLDFRTYFNNHRTHTSLEGRTPDTPASRPIANLRSFGWQPHCRSLFQTPMAA